MEDDIISGYIESDSLCRVYYNQRVSNDITLSNAEKETRYLFTISSNGNFSVIFDVNAVQDEPYIVLYASCNNDQTHDLLNYYVDKKYYCRGFAFL